MAASHSLVLATFAAVAAASFTVAAQEVIPGEFIALLEEGTSEELALSHRQFVEAGGMQVTHIFNMSSTFVGFAFSARTSPQALGASPLLAASLASRPGVVDVEANAVVRSAAAPACKVQSDAVPWGLDRIWQPAATRWLSYSYQYDEDARDVTAYIIDTGINVQHVEFEGRASWGLDLCMREDAPRTDVNGHGTHVAGTVMSRKFGVAKKARAVAVKVLCGEDGSGSITKVLAGIDWSVKQHKSSTSKKSVINLSLGGSFSAVENKAVNAAASAGLVVVVAAGNENKDACEFSPASASAAITVMSSDSNDALSSFSNWGRCGDLIAPGRDILSTSIRSRTATETLSGTSMAAPHVAGAVAKLLARGFSADKVKSQLSKIATRIPQPKRRQTTNRLLFSPCPATTWEVGIGSQPIVNATALMI